MSQKQLALLSLVVAAALSACSQPKEDAIVQTDADSQKIEVPGVSIETKGDASTVVTSDETEITITGNKSVQTRACTGQDVQMQGDDNQATFTGSCKELYVIGGRNTVTLENVEAIQVTGDDNTVRWRGTEPQVTNIGKGNTIAKAE
ncbi:hypothetical protein BEN47_06875 [Hymenobacter lapidarius]|uniref:DUF3060 domain-containing protein n=1 Tax=Hymenobacter lapidarius TaxID=1908237 RepID=A0A1G1TFF0_9BACT|nr:DUF3060 domain-containing protein [Hymenobacter lapidarius]OGX89600.1 hypothetical protein BEN47_06875 [Hymenobacter lapidarius]